MPFIEQARRSCVALCRAALVAGLIIPVALQAAPGNTLVVRNDRGGVVSTRIAQVAALQRHGTRVEFRGGVCLSSCTMLLAVRDICISPEARFGFHGPSSHGRALSAHDFEHWSQVISDYYAPSLRRWFMEKARYKTNGYHQLTGRQLIKMGYPQCR